MAYTEAQLDLILDSYVEKSDVHFVAEKTGLSAEDVRVLFENGQIANRAAARKMTSCAVWFLGIGMDAIRDALVDDEVPLREKLQAIRLTKDIMQQFTQHELTQPPALPPAVEPKAIEAVVIEAPSLEKLLEAIDD